MPKFQYFRQPKIYAATPAEKKAFFSRWLIISVVALVLLLALAWFVCLSPYFKIKTITISGSLNPEVAEEINKFKGKNILFFRVGKIEKELAQGQTSISSLEIYKGIPDILRIKVNVRNPMLIWQTQGKNYFIDKNGIIFELNNYNTQNDNEDGTALPLIIDNKNINVTLGSQIITPEFGQYVLDLNNNFFAKMGTKIKEFRINETTLQIEVITEAGWRALLDSSRNYEAQLSVLKKIFDQYGNDIKEYVDLRVEGRAYYK